MDSAPASLRCPVTGGPLRRVEGGLAADGGPVWPDRGGWIDFLGERRPASDAVTDATFESFGYEWTTFDRIQPEDEDWWRWYTADVPWDRLEGADALDAGCGKGRYTRFTAQRVGSMIALDGSVAVTAAARNLADLPNTLVVRADLRHPPVAPASLDFVTSLGVLHHLPDPEDGFRRLVALLRPGGRILVYLYSRPAGAGGARAAGLRAATALRKLTTRLSHRTLRIVAAPVAAGLYAGLVIPGAIGQRRGIARLEHLPLATYRGKPLRGLWLDTFDRLSAPVEHRYTWAELKPWFDRAGLEVEAARDEAGWFVLARRPGGGDATG